MAEPEKSENKKPRVLVCTSSLQSNVQGFIDCISREFGHLARDFQFYQLPYNDVSDFSFRDRPVDAVILCHSIHNRRMAITDVTDALYDRFLSNAAQFLGKNNIAVIVHDMPSKKLDKNEKYKQQIEFLKITQPTTFKSASLVAMAGQLAPNPPELIGDTNTQLRRFMEGTSLQRSVEGKPRVFICTSGEESNLQGFFDHFKQKFDTLASTDKSGRWKETSTSLVKFCQVPRNDVSEFSFRDRPVDAVILCHSVKDGGMTVSDETKVLYEKFLSKAKQVLGKNNIGLIVHDMPSKDMKELETNEGYKKEIEDLKTHYASLVMMAGQLAPDPPDLFEGSDGQLEKFMKGISLTKSFAG